MFNRIKINTKVIACYLLDARRFIRAAHLDSRRTRSREGAKAHLLRLSHSLEKGMALPKPRKGFGSKLAVSIMEDLEGYFSAYGPDNISYNCLKVVESTATYHLTKGADSNWATLRAESARLRKEYDLSTIKQSQAVGAVQLLKQEIIEFGPRDPKAFLHSRKSVRQFSGEPITEQEIRIIVDTARRCPSVCNRQGARVHAFTDPETRNKILKFQDGNGGFGDTASALFVITSDLSIFYKSGERNQAFVDGGIFAMSLAVSFHSYGMGSCLLNWSMTPRQDAKLREIIDIPEHEVIVSMMVAGNLRDEFLAAASSKRPLGEVLFLNGKLKV